ncbi:hypothetical protein C9374_010120 [Naegleria lovaniensis]|uniref:Palmitoyltransferase n=1 Tax=Naegleria lovaniensis TaxID=51637 RepID=A0AA88GEK1_NAELO|nr:uncharacterized protein C9374_010120 [Naegleria lovaniensis]KAG2375116.1 hypothetical protein C9374_010120 [Naegleria lovaniensis]
MPSFASEVISSNDDDNIHSEIDQQKQFSYHQKEHNIWIDPVEEEDSHSSSEDNKKILLSNNNNFDMDESSTHSDLHHHEDERVDHTNDNSHLYSITTNKEHQAKRGPPQLQQSRRWYSWIFTGVALVLLLWVILGYLFTFALPVVLSSDYSAAVRILHALYFIIFAFISACVLYPFYKCIYTHPGFVFKDDKTWALTPQQIEWYKRRGPNFLVELEREIHQVMGFRGQLREMNLQSENTEDNPVTSSLSDANGESTQSTHNNQHGNVSHHHDEEEDVLSFSDRQTSELNSRGQIRICERCWIRKPDRAHHCRQLNCCVLRMDHFCPWFNNCIGFYNHKYFFLFLVWISIGGLFAVLTMSKTLFNALKLQGTAKYAVISILQLNQIWIYIISFCFGFAMLFFAGYHLKLILFNTTTIESMEKERRLYDQHKCHPYDIGVLNNVKSILGNNPLLWLSPFHVEYSGDGCHFPIHTYELVPNRHADQNDAAVTADTL